jgi:hypothetical protein
VTAAKDSVREVRRHKARIGVPAGQARKSEACTFGASLPTWLRMVMSRRAISASMSRINSESNAQVGMEFDPHDFGIIRKLFQ